MNFFLKNLLFFSLALLCLACSQKPAQVLNRGKVLYSHNNQIGKEKYKNLIKKEAFKAKELAPIKETPKPITATSESPANQNIKNSQIEIVAGDTLLSISKKHQVTLHDLIKQNNLSPPYNLARGSKLTIPAPNYHEVKKGDTLYSISRLYNMKIDNLIEMNDLKEPYAVKLGEKIRIAKFATEEDNAPKLANVESKQNKIENPQAEPSLVEKITDKFNHFSWPLKGEILSQFGPKKGGLYNDGINIKAKEGSEVKAAEDGMVAYVGNELKGYGNLVIVKHANGWITAYAHLKNSLVTRGQAVKKGDKIATVGASGNVNSPQLYFGLRKGRDAVNPQNYLK